MHTHAHMRAHTHIHTHIYPLQLTQGELTNKQLPIRQSLDQTVESLKPQLSVADSERVEQQLVEVHHQWQKLEETLDSRKKGNLGTVPIYTVQ